MKFVFYGGAREVGRSAIGVFTKDISFMLDCGVKLGRSVEFPLIDKWDKPVFVSHSHLDHIGYIPHIKPPKLFMTKVSWELAHVILSDYRRVSGLIEDRDIKEALFKAKRLPYGEFVVDKVKFSFLNAGHILGSSMIYFEVEGKKVLYTGDFNVRGSRILDGAKPVKADILIIEGTYSSKEDKIPSLKDSIRELVNIIDKVLQRKGVVIIPSFAVGRAQEIALALENYMRSGRLSNVPIYLDGMIRKVMRIYRKNVLWAKKQLWMSILESMYDPFQSKFFYTPRTRDKTDVETPSIIITTSGMITGGPVVSYLKRFGKDEKNAIVLVGYQAEGTPGRDLLEGKRKIVVEGEEIEVNAEVYFVKISGHPDRSDLERFISEVKPSTIIAVHGEEKKLKEFVEDIDGIAPSVGEEVEV